MQASLPILRDVSLRDANTFGIDIRAHAYLRVTEVEQLAAVRADPQWSGLPRLVLGGGSNIVFTRDFPGLVLHMATQGIQIVGEDAQATYVQAAAGENWHALVAWTLDRGYGGLENLAWIPGTVGAAPVQNIGAYGAELADCFHALRYFDLATGEIRTLDKVDCAFAYRDSIFKHALRDRAVILDVTLALPKAWQPNTGYADVAQELAARGMAVPSPRDIGEAVVAIRRRKLPDPTTLGNAGSFFKNPIVSASQKNALTARYPQLVSYPQTDGQFKLAAGWLVDQCGWKGRDRGQAGVSEHQALVLVNRGNAHGADVLDLAQAIQADVAARFGVTLDIEPVLV